MSLLAPSAAASCDTRPPRHARRTAVPIRAALVVALGASAAAAQPARRSEPSATTSVAAGVAAPGIGRPFCIAECPRDTNPCDPSEFKRADGRCDIGSN